MTRIALIGSTGWQNRRKVQETLQKLKSQFNDDLNELIIVGAGGTEGANSMIRKYALEFGLRYEEYNTSF